ncbi:alpha/beta fold hydrolase, partial [Lactobacillus crispatus]|uniref:alpha/beta fold hydrolase n=1 Tax=Lactobacillus crispatus TaxID=47770 RepID=UPI00105F573E
PDLPGFGFTEVPADRNYTYSFDALAQTIGAFVDTLRLTRYAIYVFDYGAPVGFRLALARPQQIAAIVSQNGNAYEEGLSSAWTPIQTYWANPTRENRDALRAFLTSDGQRFQYLTGASNPQAVAPETYLLDTALL